MGVKSESTYLPDFLKWEQDSRYSREKVTVLAGAGADRVLTTGMVLGKITKGAATAAAFAGNTGNGAMGTITVGADAKPGVYKLVIIEPGTNAGIFTVEDPDGITVGRGTVGVAFSGGGLAFTLADGSTDFVAGDGFDITVAAGSGKYVQLDLTGTDGREDAAGVLVADVTAPNGVDATGAAIVRDAIVAKAGLTWPAGITSNQKATALAQLAFQGIIARDSA